MKTQTHFLLAAALASGGLAAHAHVSLKAPQAQAGRPYDATFLVGHGCDGAATTRVAVQVPAGFTSPKPQPRAGWTTAVQGNTVTWTAGKDSAIGNHDRAEFVLAGVAPAKPATLWFKVQQGCGAAVMDWSQVPAQGTSTAGMKTPAARLAVLGDAEYAAWQQQPQAEAGWVRSSVAGQQATGAFMRLKAREAVQLVRVTTPAAGVAEVHEMKMEGDVMQMRLVAGGIAIPAGGTLELKPGGYHVMMQELKAPLAAGTTVPLTLTFRNAGGVESQLELSLPVSTQAPGTTGAAATDGHKH
jgi:copper(I)-binding protein